MCRKSSHHVDRCGLHSKSRWLIRTLQNVFAAAVSLLAKTKDPDLQGYREEHPWFPCHIAEGLIQIQFKPRILKPYERNCHEGDPNPDDTDVQLWRKKLMSRVARTPPGPSPQNYIQ